MERCVCWPLDQMMLRDEAENHRQPNRCRYAHHTLAGCTSPLASQPSKMMNHHLLQMHHPPCGQHFQHGQITSYRQNFVREDGAWRGGDFFSKEVTKSKY